MITRSGIVAVFAIWCSMWQSVALAQPGSSPQLKETVIGTYFEVRPQFEKPINNLIASLRSRLRAERAKGKLICYLSIPLSATGGGYRPVNVEISDRLKICLEQAYGPEKFYVLAPGHVETELPAVDGVQAAGGEYMWMWTSTLAGEDGLGADFDMVYFAGRSDFHQYFGIRPPNLVAGLESWMQARGNCDRAFKIAIMDVAAAKRGFIEYYVTKAGVSFSNGAHDEWNIFIKVNRRRVSRPAGGVSAQIPLYFEGRPVTPQEMEREVSPGYEKGPP